MTDTRTPTSNAGESPQTFGTLDPSFLVDRRADAREHVVQRGEGFGGKRTPPPAPPSPASDPRGEKKSTPIKREPPAPDTAARPVRVVGGPPKSKPR
jgi:hypothetical protein